MSWVPEPSSSFVIGGRPRPARGISTSRTEVIHLFIAFAVLSFDLALLQGQFTVGSGFNQVNFHSLLTGLGFGAMAAFTGFVAHELAHKVVAERYGFWSEFRLSPTGLLLSLVTAFFGFLFAAPGATLIDGMGDVREWGRSSLAGPLVNLVESLLLLAGSLAGAWVFHSFTIWSVLLLLAFFNGWFCVFNLLPFGPLDGRKVWRWNRGVWAAVFGAGVVLTLAIFLTLSVPMPVS